MMKYKRTKVINENIPSSLEKGNKHIKSMHSNGAGYRTINSHFEGGGDKQNLAASNSYSDQKNQPPARV